MPGIKFPEDPPAASSGEESEDVTMDEEEEEVENDDEEEEEEDPEEDEEEDDEEGEEESETEEEKVDVVNRLVEADQDEFMRKYPYLTESLRNENHFPWDDLGRLGALYIPNWKAKEFEGKWKKLKLEAKKFEEFEGKWKKLKLEEQELSAKKRELKTILDALKEDAGS